MKINLAGSYNLYNMNREKLTDAGEKSNKVANSAIISEEEIDFFANLYPVNKSEIVDYHFYNRFGKMDGVSKGNFFEMRG